MLLDLVIGRFLACPQVHRVPVIVDEFAKRGGTGEELAYLNADLLDRYEADLSSVAWRWFVAVRFPRVLSQRKESLRPTSDDQPITHARPVSASCVCSTGLTCETRTGKNSPATPKEAIMTEGTSRCVHLAGV